MDICGTALSRVKIRNLTREIREMFGLQEVYYFPIVHYIEWVLGNPDNDFSYDIVPIDEMKDTYGTTNTESNIMKIRQDVYEGAIAGNPRDRFTLCHELGHFLLHRPQFISFARGSVPKYCQPEWQANTFAAELMAPYDLTKDMSPEEISKKCGMSMAAANIQYVEFHKHDV